MQLKRFSNFIVTRMSNLASEAFCTAKIRVFTQRKRQKKEQTNGQYNNYNYYIDYFNFVLWT